MLMKFTYQRNLTTVITGHKGGMCAANDPKDKGQNQSHTALTIIEGSMIKQVLNISANFLHIK